MFAFETLFWRASFRRPEEEGLASNIICPRCGAANTPGTSFCVSCGTSLTGTAGGVGPATPWTPGSAPPYPSAYPGPAPGMPWDPNRQKQIGRTRTGVLLLLIGSLLSWIPIIQIIGGLLLLVGAILVILGRKAFGPAHGRNVVISIVIFILGFVISFAAGFFLAFALIPAFTGGAPSQAAVVAALQNGLIVVFIAAAIGGIASVLFTFALQNKIGKSLLVAGYAASIVVQAIVLFVVSGLIPATVAAMFPGGIYDQNAGLAAVAGFQSQSALWGLLSVIPAALFAGADYLAWTRIKKGEIPAVPTPPGMPPVAAPIQPR